MVDVDMPAGAKDLGEPWKRETIIVGEPPSAEDVRIAPGLLPFTGGESVPDEPAEQTPEGRAIETLKAALKEDPDYAWSWHCNLAISFIDAGCDHKVAQDGARRFMRLLFDVETKEPGS